MERISVDDKQATLQLADGLTFHKRADGINHYIIETMSHEAVKAWEHKVIELDREAAANGQHIRTILEVRSVGVSFSAMAAIARTGKEAPDDLVESTAVLLTSPGFMMTMLRGVVRKLPKRARESIDFFDSVEDAILWLDQRKNDLGK